MKFLYRSLIFSFICYLHLSSYGQVTLPWTEGFENVGPVTTFYNDSYPINGLPNWSYDEVHFKGRLRFEMGSGFYHTGTKAATLDKVSTSYFLENANFLILELDLSKYLLSTDLALSFYHMHHSDLYMDDYDKVWIRGSKTDKWIQIYDLVANQGAAGTWVQATGLDIDAKLGQADPPQKVTSTFQVRFGQHGYNSTVSTGFYQGRTFDDVTISGTHCGHPLVFKAGIFSSNAIRLNWAKNDSNQDVLIAVNSTNTFGNPVNGVSYSAGNTLSGGGTIIYAGSDLSFLHTGLNPNESYYYKSWSYSESFDYSCGITDNNTTPCTPVSSFPYTQDFENSGFIPSCWDQEYISGDDESWVFTKGNRGKAHPANAHSGNFNACLQDTDDEDDISLLITPPFDLSIFSSATLSFWHTQEYFLGNQDELKVYYKTDAGSNWVLLNSYTSNISSWANESISLPDLSSAYYIAFEGNARYGYGICIDDFVIDGILVTYPIADFVADTLTPAIGDTVTFTDLSTNDPTSWIWTFDPETVTYVNGTDSASQNPQVQFTASGNYSVELVAANANGSDAVAKVDYIIVLPLPEADFSADTLIPAIGDTVTFTDLSTNDPTSWIWTFDPVTVTYVNGTDSASQNPQVQFTASGNYSVELIATNASGNDTVTKVDYIIVLPLPEADFSADKLTPAIGDTVTFTDLSLNNPTSWIWTFDPETVTYVNGTDSASQNPQVQFTASGNYSVELIATNASGNDTVTKVDYIIVLPLPEADFSADKLTPAIGDTVTFTDLSTNDPTSWSWTFDPVTVTYVNGTDSATQNPQVQFTASGNYSVELIATNASGNDTVTKVDYIFVLPLPEADFSADILTPAIGDTVTFTDLSTNDPTSWIWTFDPVTVTYVNGTDSASQNPQVQFTASGNYTVELIATNASGNDAELKINYIIVLNPVISIDLTVFLEGPFSESTMIPQLSDFIPLNQPYNIQPWNYNGTESVGSLPVSGIIDWVLVELRDAPDAVSASSSSMVSRQAAFVLNNGKIVSIDGSSVLEFENTLQHQLFVVVYHRNHLGIMSSNYLTDNEGVYSYDFTDGPSKAFGGSNNGQKEIGIGKYGMFSGDGNHNGIIESDDKSVIWNPQSGTSGYLESDYNLDKESNNLDKNDFWYMNLGMESQVPD